MTKKEKLFLYTEYEKARRACNLWRNDGGYLEDKTRHEFLLLGDLVDKFIPDLDEQGRLYVETLDTGTLKDYLPDYA